MTHPSSHTCLRANRWTCARSVHWALAVLFGSLARAPLACKPPSRTKQSLARRPSLAVALAAGGGNEPQAIWRRRLTLTSRRQPVGSTFAREPSPAAAAAAAARQNGGGGGSATLCALACAHVASASVVSAYLNSFRQRLAFGQRFVLAARWPVARMLNARNARDDSNNH